MSGVRTVAGLFILGASLSVVLFASGVMTPVVQRVAGILSSEIATAGAGGNGNGWGG